MKDKLRFFGFSLAVTLASLLAALIGMGWSAALVMVVLILVEVTFSFENAVINAKVLKTLSPRWQTIFLTVGIFIAIFGMRVVFPVVIVMLTGGLGWREVVDLALNNPDTYAEKLEAAHHSIAAFGGAFLLMLFLHFFFDRNKQTHWIEPIEKPLQRLGHIWLPSMVSAAVIVGLAALPANHYVRDTLQAGLFGILTFVGVRGIEHVFAWFKGRSDRHRKNKAMLQTGWAAFATFLYLEILDASFSFDGVIGAFAITRSVILIALGLGVGAFWVRSLTVYMVRRGSLDKYLYLEHGAHYTVGVLAATLLLSILYPVPEVVAGAAGITLVGGAFLSSRKANS